MEELADSFRDQEPYRLGDERSDMEQPFVVPRRTRYENRVYWESVSLTSDQNGALESYGKYLNESPSFPIEATTKMVEIVANLRNIGWFTNRKRYSDVKLASTLINVWFYAYDEVLTQDDPLLVHYLISMDEKRSWQRPILILETFKPMVRKDGVLVPHSNPVSDIYFQLTLVLYNLGIGGNFVFEDLGTLHPDGDFAFEISYRRKKALYKFPISKTVITPWVFTEIPEIVKTNDREVWFIELRENRAGITVVSEEQRNQLEELTGISLKKTPPDWWAEAFEKSRKGLYA